MPTPLFVYGTLRAPELLTAVLGRETAMVRAAAPGFRTVFYPGRIYPALVPGEGAAEGLILPALTGFDLSLLDLFEGDEYERRPIAVVADGKEHAAEVYWPLTGAIADGPPWRYEDWYNKHAAGMLSSYSEGAAAIRARLIAMGSE